MSIKPRSVLNLLVGIFLILGTIKIISEDLDVEGFTKEEQHETGSNPRNSESIPEEETTPDSVTYPQLALGEGYQCILMISNLIDESWEGKASLRFQSNQLWPDSWSINGVAQEETSSFDIRLPGYATRKFVLTGTSSLHVGYLELAALPGFTNESVSLSFFYNYSNQRGLIDSIGVEQSQASSRFLFPVEKNSTVDTGFALAPVREWLETREDEEDLVSLTLFNQLGEIHQQINLPFNGHFAKFFSEVFEELPDEFLGKILVQAGHNIHLTVLRLEKSPAGKVQITSIPPDYLPEFVDPSSLLYSQLALGGGYKSVVVIANNSESIWFGRIELLTAAEQNWNGSVWLNEIDISLKGGADIDIPAGGTRKFELVGDETLRTGYLRVRGLEDYSTEEITSSYFYNYGNSSELIDSTGVSSGQPSRQFVFPVEKDQSVDTGFAWALFANSQTEEEEPIEFDINISLFDKDGNLFERREAIPVHFSSL